jgi:beta-galactosidase/beta-glucuronidase
MWYRRFVEIPKDWAGRRVLLHFGAVDWEATAHVNGRQVGAHRGGYDAFAFDITDALDKRGGPQEILVGVVDPTDQGDQPRGKQVLRPEGIWFSAVSGIWQTAWLEPVPEVRLVGLAMAPDLAGRCLRLKVNAAGNAAGLEVTAVVRDGDAEVSRTVGALDAELRLPVPTMKLWSPANPFLYGLRVSIGKGEKAADSVESYFAMRHVEVATDGRRQRVLLNGQFLFQVGVLDQGYWPDGLYAAPTDEALRYDLQTARNLGFNMVRKHVKVEPERWYYWADKLGLLVWQDMPSANNRTPQARKAFEEELDRLVAGLRNHPSIVTWVLYNEGWGQFDTERLTAHLKGLDPTRLVDSASGWKDAGVGDVVDTHHYPDPEVLPPEVFRASVVGEFGGIRMPVEGHTWAPIPAQPQGRPGADPLTEPYQKMLRTCWRLKDYPGASAVVYTEISDVETEYCGLMTYDREVVKGNAERITAVNRGEPKP